MDEYELSAANASVVDANADCIKKVNRPISIFGHTDPRGTVEYNLNLSEKRAQSVKRRLRALGIAEQNMNTVARGELDSVGADETAWGKDRRVEVTFR